MSDLNLNLSGVKKKYQYFTKTFFKVFFGYIAIDSYDDKMDARMFVE